MNATIIAIAISAASIASSAAAQDRHTLSAVSVESSARVIVDCRAQQRPSMRAVANVLQTNNGSRIYAERERLLNVAQRECMHGIGYVAFVRDAAAPAPTLALADLPTAR